MVLSPNEMESRYVREEDKKLKNLEERSFLSFTALPAAIVKKFAVLVRNLVEGVRFVIQYTTVQDNILAARENIQRIKLNRLTLADRLRTTLLAFPTASGPYIIPVCLKRIGEQSVEQWLSSNLTPQMD